MNVLITTEEDKSASTCTQYSGRLSHNMNLTPHNILSHLIDEVLEEEIDEEVLPS